jgi:hypothetical protein
MTLGDSLRPRPPPRETSGVAPRVAGRPLRRSGGSGNRPRPGAGIARSGWSMPDSGTFSGAVLVFSLHFIRLAADPSHPLEARHQARAAAARSG